MTILLRLNPLVLAGWLIFSQIGSSLAAPPADSSVAPVMLSGQVSNYLFAPDGSVSGLVTSQGEVVNIASELRGQIAMQAPLGSQVRITGRQGAGSSGFTAESIAPELTAPPVNNTPALQANRAPLSPPRNAVTPATQALSNAENRTPTFSRQVPAIPHITLPAFSGRVIVRLETPDVRFGGALTLPGQTPTLPSSPPTLPSSTPVFNSQPPLPPAGGLLDLRRLEFE